MGRRVLNVKAYLTAILLLFLGFLIGNIFGLWLTAQMMKPYIEKMIENGTTAEVGKVMRANQACVAKWKNNSGCVEWH